MVDVEFVIPGSLEPATVSGFGAVFSDADIAGASSLEFFDSNGRSILSRNILATPGNESLSFLGVTFTRAEVAKVRITSGTQVGYLVRTACRKGGRKVLTSAVYFSNSVIK